ncbi:MAG: hypothetical protein FGM54_12140 [Chitinophagaceae bacterium]|nr:hypothetical protein [Chitinophagaceae bacterium]
MISTIFGLVANALHFIACKTGLTYNEINIIVYYFLIPFSWLCLVDAILAFQWFKLGGLLLGFVFSLWCRNFSQFSDDLFENSVRFLNYFNRFGSNYFASSVWICVALPLLIYGILIYILVFRP